MVDQTVPSVLLTTAGVGGRPTVHQDIPALAVFLALYTAGAIIHMTIFQTNRRRGRKFLPSWAMFGFCMTRIVTCILRIVWTTHLANARLAIAAEIFLNVGVLVAYVVNLVLATRILRATQPKIGWNKALDRALTAAYIALGIAIALIISFTITSFYTLDSNLKTSALWIQRCSLFYVLIFNCAPTVVLLSSALSPKNPDREDFGTRSIESKFIILGVSNFFCLFIAGFRCGTTWAAPRPPSNPAWYDQKAAFYIIGLAFELVVIYLFIFTRFDRVFWVPDGCNQNGDYSRRMSTEYDRAL